MTNNDSRKTKRYPDNKKLTSNLMYNLKKLFKKQNIKSDMI